jgi:truncated hemoglobin YjbI
MDGTSRDEERTRHRTGPLAPDPELWAALDEGRGLSAVLEDFYERVYRDERLKHFFAGVTRDWVAQKQYTFMRSILTGERVYFGHRPRNAHHWMVISDELFDYREELLASCLRDYGLPEPLVARVRAIDECFRKQIVKDQPFPRKFGGMTFQLEGVEPLEMVIGTLCDACQGEIAVGETAWVHARTGQARCCGCSAGGAEATG